MRRKRPSSAPKKRQTQALWVVLGAILALALIIHLRNRANYLMERWTQSTSQDAASPPGQGGKSQTITLEAPTPTATVPVQDGAQDAKAVPKKPAVKAQRANKMPAPAMPNPVPDQTRAASIELKPPKVQEKQADTAVVPSAVEAQQAADEVGQ